MSFTDVYRIMQDILDADGEWVPDGIVSAGPHGYDVACSIADTYRAADASDTDSLDAVMYRYRLEPCGPAGIKAGDMVSLFVSECGGRVSGIVLSVYTNAVGSLVADVDLGWREPATQNVEFLKLV